MSRSAGKKGAAASQLVAVDVSILKTSLNKVYADLHGRGQGAGLKASVKDEVFQYLWDLKEMALLEKRSVVELPQEWLDQLNESGDSVLPVRH